MEIDVTPDGNSLVNSEASCHVEEENVSSCAVDHSVSSTDAGTASSVSFVDNKDSHPTSSSSKKNIRHALRHQAKRKRKNTLIANDLSGTVPRIVVKSVPPEVGNDDTNQLLQQTSSRTLTMKEILASIPGFNMKTRKRTNKKLSTAAQLEQTKAGCIDLETPDSILVNTNLRLLLNRGTFASLPLLYQNKLAQLLPLVDRQLVNNSTDPNCIEISSGLNNEFFARACVEWQYRLAEGEFTPENQQKLKLEADKERSKLDPWKLKHFEPIWGDRSTTDATDLINTCKATTASSRPPIKTTIKLRPSTTSATKTKAPPPPPIKRLRTVGAMTRSCTILKEEISKPNENKSPIPDLLPIKQIKPIVQIEENLQKSDEVLAAEELKQPSSDSSTVEIHDNCIVNISDAILENNQETIIICRDETAVETDKRPRSASSGIYENSPKRSKSMSPLALSVETGESVHGSELKDPLDLTSEVASDDDKISDHTSESIEAIDDLYEKERIIDENSSSSCSMAVQNMDEISSSGAIETVDSLQLHMNYEDVCHVDETSSTTSATSTNTDVKSEQESEMTQDQDETMTSIPDISESAMSMPESSTSSSLDEKSRIVEVEDSGPITLNTMETDIVMNQQETILEAEPQTSYQDIPEIIDEHSTESTLETVQDTTSENIIEEPTVYDSQQEINDTDTQKIEEEPFQMLPNTLIIQQEALVLQNVEDNITAVTAERLEETVEEADLVPQLFHSGKIIQDDDGEDRFIDAENYVLESGQISVSTTETAEKKCEGDIHAALFGENVTTGKCYIVI